MADLYGNNESEDMSSFLQILLNNSSAAAATTDTTASAPAGGLFIPGEAPTGLAESSSRINFSDYSSFFPKESDEINTSNRVKNLASGFEGSEASEGQVNPAIPRSSSKRSRAAEVHNLSEKRRRSRINEKLKALQNLIPNSNKTDKASMLDEAIEYLKQLQLQVQVLVSILSELVVIAIDFLICLANKLNLRKNLNIFKNYNSTDESNAHQFVKKKMKDN